MTITPNDLIKLREMNGWSQRDLAAFLDVDQSTISRYESGETKISGPARIVLEQLMKDTYWANRPQ